jgi:endonuclease YncB( thermonuclease family)
MAAQNSMQNMMMMQMFRIQPSAATAPPLATPTATTAPPLATPTTTVTQMEDNEDTFESPLN